MDYIIVTNNNLVSERFEDSIFIDGDYIDILLEVRKYTHEGYKLINYPLNASIRMIFSPVKSILISKEKGNIHLESIEIIEGSIDKYRNIMGKRKPDYKNLEDYKTMDYTLFLSAIDESKRLN